MFVLDFCSGRNRRPEVCIYGISGAGESSKNPKCVKELLCEEAPTLTESEETKVKVFDSGRRATQDVL